MNISSNEIPRHIGPVLKLLPEKPGIYQFIDEKGTIIYVGKAKNIRKRVSSYFTKIQVENRKTWMLIKKTKNISHLVVDNESEALLLENSLIKQYQPKYNILLKDDKTFPWICIKNEPFPRVFLTRKIVEDGSTYFGPYTSARMVRMLIRLIKQLYKLRTCNYILTQQNIAKGNFKVCLEYHLGNCLAPCIGLQEEENYLIGVNEIKNILRGNITNVIKYLNRIMKEFAEDYKFEEANLIKDKIEALEKFKNKSTVVNTKIHNIDVFSILSDEKYGYVNFLKVIKGAIVQAHSVELKKQLNENDQELLTHAIVQLRERLQSDSSEIVLPVSLDIPLPKIKIIVPKSGDKKKLLELSERNVKLFRREKMLNRDSSAFEIKVIKKLEQVKSDLRLKALPKHIECFDNSNLQGTNPVAACVVFRDLKPSKKEYRHYNIKTVVGPDDYASMKEVIQRRYTRLMTEGENLPGLIIIDGGKGQLNAALNSLRDLKLENKIAIIGIAKRLEEIFFPNDPIPLYLDKNSVTLKIIQHLRNEAHRFGITFHRDKRSKSAINSRLIQIIGVGDKTLEKLLTTFKSVDNIRSKTFDELADVIGSQKAKLIYDYFIKGNSEKK